MAPRADLRDKLLRAVQAVQTAGPRWQDPRGIFFAEAPAQDRGKVAMLFPGQGSQYTGMLRDLACHFPQMFNTLAAADDGFELPHGKRLSDLIYPIPVFKVGEKEKQEEELRATEAAQPAIGAVSLGALRVLESFGIAPHALAGHSYGELTALCAGGLLDEAALHNLSRLRGRLMGEGKGDKGSMLAVSTSLATVEQVIAEERLDLDRRDAALEQFALEVTRRRHHAHSIAGTQRRRLDQRLCLPRIHAPSRHEVIVPTYKSKT